VGCQAIPRAEIFNQLISAVDFASKRALALQMLANPSQLSKYLKAIEGRARQE
jgi:hypothetical protein